MIERVWNEVRPNVELRQEPGRPSAANLMVLRNKQVSPAGSPPTSPPSMHPIPDSENEVDRSPNSKPLPVTPFTTLNENLHQENIHHEVPSGSPLLASDAAETI